MIAIDFFIFVLFGVGVFAIYAKLRNSYPHDPRCDELIRYLLDQADELTVHYEYDYLKTNYLRVIDNKGFNYYFYVYDFDNYLYRCTKSSTSDVIYGLVQPSRWLQLLFWWKIERKARFKQGNVSFIQKNRERENG